MLQEFEIKLAKTIETEKNNLVLNTPAMLNDNSNNITY
jgi:hypothetical protein